MVNTQKRRQIFRMRGNKMKLLIVDSDQHIVEMLTGWLKTLGYEVRRAYTGERAKIEWMEQRPDLVILDTGLKDIDALAMCRDMRIIHDALVLAVADEKDIQDEVRCLESGADDYLRKPFYPSQLLARIRAISRRARSTLEQRPSSILTVGPIRVDALHNEVSVQGKTSRLTPTESKMLHFLAVNVNDVCTAGQIETHASGYNGDGDASFIHTHILHLRHKVEPGPGHSHHHCTV